MKFYLLLFAILLALTVSAAQFSVQPDASTITSPATIILNIMLANTQPVYGFELTIEDTPEHAVFSHISTTSRTANALATSAAQGDDTVKIAVILSGSGSGITAGNESILRLFYTVSGGSGQVTFTPSNLVVYNKNGAVISGNTITGAAVTIQSSSLSSGSSSGGGGGGGSGSGSSGQSGGSSASTSTNSYAPVDFPAPRQSKETAAQQRQPKVVEAKMAPETPVATPEPSQTPPRRSFIPVAMILLIAAGAIVSSISVYIKTRTPSNPREKYAKELKKRQE